MDFLEKNQKMEEADLEPEERLEEEMVDFAKHRRSYWEFGVFVAIVIVLTAVVAVLAFLLVKTFSNKDAEKVSIQNISKEVVENNKTEDKVEVKEEKEESKTPVVKEVVPTEVAIKILNGGAVGGSAGKVKEALVAKGYKKVEAGNSDKNSYVGVNVFYQAEMKTAAEKVAADLKIKYPTAQAKAGASVEEKSGPIVIILGK